MMRLSERTRSGFDSRRPAVVALLCTALAGCSSSSGPGGETDHYRGAYEPRTHHSVPVEWIFDDPGDLPFEFTAWLWWPHG